MQRRLLIQLEGSLFLYIGMLREVREHEEHAARMLGQWVEKQEQKIFETLTDEQLERIAAGALPLGSGKGPPSKAPDK
jgi:hypothetical protein